MFRRSPSPPRTYFRALLFVLLVCPSGLLIRADEPKSIHPTAYVTDLAGVIPDDSKARLEALCGELRRKTGAQLAIVTVNSLEDKPVDRYAHELFQSLGVGRKKENDGVLLLIAPNEHKYWTSVGYGLETVITKDRATDAGHLMVPYFRQNNYGAGVEAAADQLAQYIAREREVPLNLASSNASPVQVPATLNDDNSIVWKIIFVIFFVGIVGAMIYYFFRWLVQEASQSGSGFNQGTPNLFGNRSNTYNTYNTYNTNDPAWNAGLFGGNSSTFGAFGGSSDTSSNSGDSSWSSGSSDSGSFGGFDGGSSSSDSGGGGSW